MKREGRAVKLLCKGVGEGKEMRMEIWSLGAGECTEGMVGVTFVRIVQCGCRDLIDLVCIQPSLAVAILAFISATTHPSMPYI